MSNGVIVVGNGGHARVVIDALQVLGIPIAGVVAESASSRDRGTGMPLLGDDAWLARRGPREVRLVNGIGGIVPMGRRAEIFDDLKRQGFTFVTVIHPTATIADGTNNIGEGSFIAAGSVVQVGARVGLNCVINTGAIVDHDAVVEDHAQVGPGAVLAGEVTVRKGAYVGAGATVLQGRTLGEACQVGAGAVVTKDVAANKLVLGVPAREKSQ